MKTLDADVQAKLNKSVTNLVLCLKIIRQDGLEIGFTGHDKAFTYDGTLFSPDRSFMEPSTRNETTDDKIGEFRFHAILDSILKRTEFISEVYDHATVKAFLIDPLNPTANQIPPIQTGVLGEINNSGERAQIEFRGLKQYLNQQTIQSITATCGNTFGYNDEARSFCQFDIDNVTYHGIVDQVVSQKEFYAYLDPITGTMLDPQDYSTYLNKWFEFGLLTWTIGDNVFNGRGRSIDVQKATLEGGRWNIHLITFMALTLQEGDEFDIQAGCDLDFFGKCANVYGRTKDFKGFPFANDENLLAR